MSVSNDIFSRALELPALLAISDHPHAFGRLKAGRGSNDVRHFVLTRFPYKVVHEIRPEQILVLGLPIQTPAELLEAAQKLNGTRRIPGRPGVRDGVLPRTVSVRDKL